MARTVCRHHAMNGQHRGPTSPSIARKINSSGAPARSSRAPLSRRSSGARAPRHQGAAMAQWLVHNSAARPPPSTGRTGRSGTMRRLRAARSAARDARSDRWRARGAPLVAGDRAHNEEAQERASIRGAGSCRRCTPRRVPRRPGYSSLRLASLGDFVRESCLRFALCSARSTLIKLLSFRDGALVCLQRRATTALRSLADEAAVATTFNLCQWCGPWRACAHSLPVHTFTWLIVVAPTRSTACGQEHCINQTRLASVER